MRCSCRACRMKKCIHFGMDSSIIQRGHYEINSEQKNKILSNIETNFNSDDESRMQFINRNESEQSTENIEKLFDNCNDNVTSLDLKGIFNK